MVQTVIADNVSIQIGQFKFDAFHLLTNRTQSRSDFNVVAVRSLFNLKLFCATFYPDSKVYQKIVKDLRLKNGVPSGDMILLVRRHLSPYEVTSGSYDVTKGTFTLSLTVNATPITHLTHMLVEGTKFPKVIVKVSDTFAPNRGKSLPKQALRRLDS